MWTFSNHSLASLPLARTLDLRREQIAKVVWLWLIHHVKYPLAFPAPCVDYSNDGSLIFGIRLETYWLINWLDPTTRSSCKELP